MAPKVPWKALSRRGAFSSKQLAFFGVAGLILVAGVFLRAGHYFDEPAEEVKAPVAVETPPTASDAPAAGSVAKSPPAAQAPAPIPNEAAKQADEAVQQAAPKGAEQPTGKAAEQAEQPALPGSGVILVSKKPVEVLASPSATAPAMYGFPAGRPFRVIGREAGFAHIQDVRSGASGWIDEAALTAPPPRQTVATPPSQSNSGTTSRTPATASKTKPAKKDAQVATDSDNSEAVQPRNRPGLFGGLFGGIFRGGN